MTEEATTLEQLSAVHAVLRPTRQATEFDILITTAMERLQQGSASVGDLTAYVRDVWGAAGVDENRLRAAMGAAVAADYCCVTKSPDGWSLTALGSAELAVSRDWAAETLSRFESELREQATRALGRGVDPAEAELWAGVIARAINRAVAFAQDAFQGDVDLLSDRSLAPKSIDRAALVGSVRGSVSDPDVGEILGALALDAVDPATPFGNELVSHVTTGHMLHGFLARRDAIRQRQTIGGLAGQRVVLDTPVLLQLLGPDEVAMPVQSAISTAVDIGMEVIVPDHTYSELIEVVDRVERGWVDAVVSGLKSGADPAILAETVDEPVIALWLKGRAAGKYGQWSDFREAARRIDGILVRMGVLRRPHGNREVERIAALSQGLKDAPRGRVQIERDAHSAEMVWRSRRTKSAGAFWPGGWFVSPDTHVRKAYRLINREDPHPLSLTVPQWIGLVSSFCPPAELDELARAAAATLAFDSMVVIAGKFPPQAAIEIAKALQGDPSGSIDARVAQLSIEELMQELPATGDQVADGARLAAAVVNMRSMRLDHAFARKREQLSEEASQARALAASQGKAAADADGRRAEAEARAAQADRRAEVAESASLRNQRTGDRKMVLAVAITALTIGGAFITYLGMPYMGLGIIGAGGMLFATARDWAVNPDTPHSKLLASLIPAALGAMGTALRWLGIVSLP